VFDDHKHVAEVEGGRDDDTEVACDHRLGMMWHKGSSMLERKEVIPTMVQTRGHILAHRGRRDAQAQLEHGFVGDAPLAPRRVVLSHTADKRL
jgi:hypothetical protein